jgi:hypothetical protein
MFGPAERGRSEPTVDDRRIGSGGQQCPDAFQVAVPRSVM